MQQHQRADVVQQAGGEGRFGELRVATTIFLASTAVSIEWCCSRSGENPLTSLMALSENEVEPSTSDLMISTPR